MKHKLEELVVIETCVLGKGCQKNTGKPRHTLKEGDSFQVDPAVMLWQDRLVSNLCSQSGHCQAPRQRKLFR